VTDPDHPGYCGPLTIPLGEIVLYVKPECPHCEDTRRDLRARGLTWREVDTTKTDALPRREQMLFAGYLRAPVLCAAGFVLVGYDPARVRELLDEHEARLARLAARALRP
jgi:glutaredoxin